MDVYLLDWLNLCCAGARHHRHRVIGASFYFVGLDNSLTPPQDDKDTAKGIGGELWAVHGGRLLPPAKVPVSPARLPEHLHWSMWESYSPGSPGLRCSRCCTSTTRARF